MNQRMKAPAVVLLLVLIVAIMFSSLVLLKVEPHIPLFFCIMITSIFALVSGVKWKQIEKGLIAGIVNGIQPLMLLFMISFVIASWMMSGAVPTLLYYGMGFIKPEWFAISALFITILVSTFTGSSFTTASTVGVALMGIAHALGVNPGLAAGAIVCGACFGDKMSPLSDSTNLASGTIGVNLFNHIRHMMWTTVPALIITAIIFVFVGHHSSGASLDQLTEMKRVLGSHFTITLWTLLSPLCVMILAFRKVSIIPTLMIGVVTAIVTTFFVNDTLTLSQIINTLQNGLQMKTGNVAVDAIINKGGLLPMMWSVSLIMIALALGGLLQSLGLLDLLLKSAGGAMKKTGHLIAMTAATGLGVNLLTGEMYLSILLPGQSFKKYYEQHNVSLLNLSRTMEDAGTLINPLVPWSVSGAFFAATLGVSALDYIPFAFLLYLSPLFTLIYGYTGIGLASNEKK
ncbi:Na+/H+ antiporter NhaC [Fictibacillus macauensis ZFHKF-1]|uniref:Na+/H+ antiporter NhaC n=1 Tax=Fictibacillus macauensis ZFHKF-1 TaxID=1196324 RepID=I8AGB3_9BACL|nr:Na+/H+ antiporter NhaC [Fictibacillus macauensis]EIT84717.1 Na+/H+ antiporter NhaC [Fictibacillus macauensis ZFHKF-1]